MMATNYDGHRTVNDGHSNYGHNKLHHCHGVWPSVMRPSMSTLWPSLTRFVVVGGHYIGSLREFARNEIIVTQ